MAEGSGKTGRRAPGSAAKTLRFVALSAAILAFVYFVMPLFWDQLAHWIYADGVAGGQ